MPTAYQLVDGNSVVTGGESGAVKSTAQTAPSGAIVNDTPLKAIIWSILPSTAIAKNAPASS